MSIFWILPTANNLMLATLIDFPPSSRNPNEEEEKFSEFLYLLSPDDKLPSILDFDKIMVVRFTNIGIVIDISIGMIHFRLFLICCLNLRTICHCLNLRTICRGTRHGREKECETVWAPKKRKINLRSIHSENIFLYSRENNFSFKTNLPSLFY